MATITTQPVVPILHEIDGLLRLALALLFFYPWEQEKIET
jgi:hypothetical protein